MRKFLYIIFILNTWNCANTTNKLKINLNIPDSSDLKGLYYYNLSQSISEGLKLPLLYNNSIEEIRIWQTSDLIKRFDNLFVIQKNNDSSTLLLNYNYQFHSISEKFMNPNSLPSFKKVVIDTFFIKKTVVKGNLFADLKRKFSKIDLQQLSNTQDHILGGIDYHIEYFNKESYYFFICRSPFSYKSDDYMKAGEALKYLYYEVPENWKNDLVDSLNTFGYKKWFPPASPRMTD